MPLTFPAGHRASIWLIGAVAASLLLMTWVHVLTQVKASREREIGSANRDLANLTRVSLEHADRTLQSADQVIRFVRKRYLESGAALDLIDLTEQGVIDAEYFPQVGIIDASGRYILANRATTGTLDLSDREHFRVHVGATEDRLFVSKPVLGRATGKWSIQLTRPILKADGRFGGVVVLSIDPGYFARFYGDLRLGARGITTLLGSDGYVRARYPDTEASYALDLSDNQLYRLLATAPHGAFVEVSPIDRVQRLLHYRQMARFPLVVVSGIGFDDVLANHARTRDALVMQGVGVSLLILGLAAVVLRQLKRLRMELHARAEAQDQLQERTEQLDTIFALSPDGFVGFDASGFVRHVNPAFRAMTHATDEVFEGRSESEFSDWLSARCQPRQTFADWAARLPPEGPARDAYRAHILISPGHKVLQVRLATRSSALVSQVLYFRDVTHEVEVDQMKSEFLSIAAHELRTPMASIYGFAEVLNTHELSEAERREFMQVIQDQSRNMSHILDELLDLARMEARRGKDFRLASLDLHLLVRDIIRAYKPPQDRQVPRLMPPPPNLLVLADAGKLRQAILNVLSNAYKYSPEGGPVLLELVERETAALRQVGLRVTDHGIGMTPEQRQRVCERFFRADKSGRLPGTGLGMSIVKEIIDVHDGEIEIRSTFGQGTQVTLWLPGSRSDATAAAPTPDGATLAAPIAPAAPGSPGTENL